MQPVQLFTGVAAKQRRNGPGKHSQADGTGDGDKSCNPGSGFLGFPGIRMVSGGELGCDGGDDADGNGCDKGAGHIEDGLRHDMDATHGVRRTLGDTGGQQSPHVDFAGKGRNDLQTGRAQSNGDGNQEQGLDGFLITPGLVLGARQALEMLPEYDKKIDHADQAAGSDTQNGAAGCQGDGAGRAQQQHGSPHAYNQFDNGLDNLGDGGGYHITLSLEEAPEGGNDADQQHTGPQKADGGPGIRLVLKSGQLAAEGRHEHAADDTEGQKNTSGCGVDTADLIVIFQRIGLGDHAAHGNGKPGGGDHKQDVVDFVGSVEIAEALFANNGVQGNFVHSAHDFHQGGGHGQYGSALQKVLTFLLIRHHFPPL